MAIFSNQATLSFGNTRVNSNVTEGEIVEIISAVKTAISTSYGGGDGVAYAISITNTGTTDMTDITIEDDLGAFVFGTQTLTPLDYVDGSVRYFRNGILEAPPTVTAGPPLVISGITVPAGSSALVLYEGAVNSFADLNPGATITNTASVTGVGVCDSVVTAAVPVREETALSIAKSICPCEISCGGEFTYTFVIQNTGNTPAVATDDVIITDTFTPAFSSVSVTYNGAQWTEGTNYTYDSTTGEFATLPGQITVPAATYTRDAATGALIITPGTVTLSVTGTL